VNRHAAALLFGVSGLIGMWQRQVMPAMPPGQLAFESLLELAKLVDDLRHPAPVEIDR
jgi:hypothetical protein